MSIVVEFKKVLEEKDMKKNEMKLGNWEDMAMMKKIVMKLQNSIFSVLQAKSVLNYLEENRELCAENLQVEYSTLVDTLKEKIEEKVVAFGHSDFYTSDMFLIELKQVLEAIVDNALVSYDLENKSNPINLEISETVEAGSELIGLCYITSDSDLKDDIVVNPLSVLKGGKN